MIGDRIEVNIAGGLDIPLPRMIHVRQKFQMPRLASVSAAVIEEFKKREVRDKVKPGTTIAVGVGSRGVNNIAELAFPILLSLVFLRGLRGKPLISDVMLSRHAVSPDSFRKAMSPGDLSNRTNLLTPDLTGD